jgi:hypothetical protein
VKAGQPLSIAARCWVSVPDCRDGPDAEWLSEVGRLKDQRKTGSWDGLR